MAETRAHPDDPLIWCVLLAAGFALIASIRLTIPSAPFFDEVHYLPAARAMLDGSEYLNKEHPLVGKQLIGVGIALLGDNALGWRAAPFLFGVLALFAAMRAVWFASLSRVATLSYGVLLATGFLLYVHSRIAMLDIFMAAFACICAWQYAAAIRNPSSARRRLALAGIALGLALASKWNAVSIAVLPGLAFLALRIKDAGLGVFTVKNAAPIPGITIWEAALWLGAVPLAVYALTFMPAYSFGIGAIGDGGIIGLHRDIAAMQSSVVDPHTYQSTWDEWALNNRAIWYLYEAADGAQRGVLLIGNPLTMLLGLPALLWCGWSAVMQRNPAAAAMVAGYIASLGLWWIADKPIQFFYHYLLPSFFLYGALALALDEFWKRGYAWISAVVLALSIALFAWFYPIMSAAPLDGVMAFDDWMWLDSWR